MDGDCCILTLYFGTAENFLENKDDKWCILSLIWYDILTCRENFESSHSKWRILSLFDTRCWYAEGKKSNESKWCILMLFAWYDIQFNSIQFDSKTLFKDNDPVSLKLIFSGAIQTWKHAETILKAMNPNGAFWCVLVRYPDLPRTFWKQWS